jgi:antitoxin component HigA of HigAB toxin-antitoxin module
MKVLSFRRKNRRGKSMDSRKSVFEQFLSSAQNRKIYEQERLLVDAAELLSLVMEKRHVSRAQLASKLGKSKAHVTQVLRGNENLTLRTLAECFWVLDCRLQLAATPMKACTAGVPDFAVTSPWAFEQRSPRELHEWPEVENSDKSLPSSVEVAA